MSAQSSLKALAGAVIGRTMQRTLPAQSEETARTLVRTLSNQPRTLQCKKNGQP